MSAIFWDQWFPESARDMALQGAKILYYPTAIGSEIQDAGIDSCDHWRGVIQGHAVANVLIFKFWQENLVNFLLGLRVLILLN